VSSFGVGGTNAHVVLEQAPQTAVSGERRAAGPTLFCFSAKDDKAAVALGEQYHALAQSNGSADFSSSAWTLFCGREFFQRRFFCVASSWENLAQELPRANATALQGSITPVFMFSGQDSPYFGMAAGLLEGKLAVPLQKVYKSAFEECAVSMKTRHGLDVREMLYGDTARINAGIVKTSEAQACIFAVSHALAQVWISAGVRPGVCIGHGIGELCAAAISGAFSLSDAIDLVMARASAMPAPPPQVSEAADQVRAAARRCRFHALSIPLISNVTGAYHTDESIRDPDYWALHMQSPGKFTQGVEEIIKKFENPVFIEMGPGTILGMLAQKQGALRQHCISSVRNPQESKGDYAYLISAFGQAWSIGLDLEATMLYGDGPYTRQSLPAYPFQRQRYWIEHDTPLAGLPRKAIEPVLTINAETMMPGADVMVREVEACCMTHQSIKECAASNNTVFFALKPGQSVTQTELRKHLRQGLPDNLVKFTFVELPGLPRRQDGKTDYAELAGRSASGEKVQTVHNSPKTEMELFLAQQWTVLLNVPEVFRQDNFFEKGGNSLLCMKLVSIIEKEKNIRLNYGVFVRATLEQAATMLQDAIAEKNK
jgi:acyl transferase domain-containing protein